jgi:hypothetical protein
MKTVYKDNVPLQEGSITENSRLNPTLTNQQYLRILNAAWGKTQMQKSVIGHINSDYTQADVPSLAPLQISADGGWPEEVMGAITGFEKGTFYNIVDDFSDLQKKLDAIADQPSKFIATASMNGFGNGAHALVIRQIDKANQKVYLANPWDTCGSSNSLEYQYSYQNLSQSLNSIHWVEIPA